MSPFSLQRLTDDRWFRLNQSLLLGIANTSYGREIFTLENLPVVRIDKNAVHYALGNDTYRADFHVGAKLGNLIRTRWTEFLSYSRYFETPSFASPLTRYSLSVHALTLTAFPDPNPETLTFDGWCVKNNAVWATAQSSATADSADDSSVTFNVGSANEGASDYSIRRGFFLFDTSSLTASASISSATVALKMSATAPLNQDNDGDDWMNIVQTAPASNTALSTADFNKCGDTVTNPTEGATRIDISTMSANTLYTWTLNASGISWISLTGITKMGLREGHDCINSSYSGTAGYNRCVWIAADTTGTGDDPKLTVTYTLVSRRNRMGLLNVA